MITCELATFVILNRKGYLRYIRSVSGNKKLVDSKVQDANQLIKCAKAGLSDLLVVSGMLARSLFFVCIGSMARFVLNHFGSRPTLRAVMDIVLETMDCVVVNHVINPEVLYSASAPLSFFIPPPRSIFVPPLILYPPSLIASPLSHLISPLLLSFSPVLPHHAGPLHHEGTLNPQVPSLER